MGRDFVLGWTLFRLTVWAAVALWMNPQLLDIVGGESIARWVLDHGWVRWVAAPPLALLALISVLEPLNDPRKRAARQELATRIGATLVDLNDLDLTYGIPDGPGLRVPLGRWSMVVATRKSRGDVHTVASAHVGTSSQLSFVARGVGREPRMMRDLQQLTAGYSLRSAKRAGGEERGQALDTLAYLSKPPIETGNEMLDRTVVLRANEPDLACALFTSSFTASSIAALNAMTRHWDWTFHPAATPGMAEMRLVCPGALKDLDTLQSVQSLMKAGLEGMAEAGILGSEDSRSAAPSAAAPVGQGASET
jgi:hypothetical protein